MNDNIEQEISTPLIHTIRMDYSHMKYNLARHSELGNNLLMHPLPLDEQLEFRQLERYRFNYLFNCESNNLLNPNERIELNYYRTIQYDSHLSYNSRIDYIRKQNTNLGDYA